MFKDFLFIKYGNLANMVFKAKLDIVCFKKFFSSKTDALIMVNSF